MRIDAFATGLTFSIFQRVEADARQAIANPRLDFPNTDLKGTPERVSSDWTGGNEGEQVPGVVLRLPGLLSPHHREVRHSLHRAGF